VAPAASLKTIHPEIRPLVTLRRENERLDAHLHVEEHGESAMSNGLLEVQSLAGTGPTPSGRELMNIFASVQLEAEMQRVLQALAVPEYMEAWMQPPDAERVECHSDSRSFDRFRIDLFSVRRLQRSIFASCFLTKPNRITYIWETGSIAEARSLVEIRLWRYQTRCTVKLKHSGLRSRAERDWHAQMWDASLNKLCALMQGTGAGPLELEH
jgi:uncharacterized protein YndB with AHSA1/START domain